MLNICTRYSLACVFLAFVLRTCYKILNSLVCFVASFKLSFVQLLLVDSAYCCSCLVCVVILCVVLCGDCFFFTLDAGLLARSQYSEGPATGHLDTGFSWFPCA